MHLEGSNVRLVHIFLLLLLQILRTGKELAQHEDGQYHPHYAQRIRHGTPQGRTRSIQSELLQRLLGRTQGRRRMPIMSDMEISNRKQPNTAISVPVNTTPTASILSRTPPLRKELKNPGPT